MDIAAGIFGFGTSPEMAEAIDRTAKHFEAMPASELMAKARQHAGGDIAAFVKATTQINNDDGELNE